MTNDSQTNQKTEQELFEEVLNARSKGEDIGKLLKDVEITESPEQAVVSDEEPETKEAPVDQPPVETKEEPKDTKDTPPAEDDWAAALPEDIRAKVTQLKDERAQLEHRVKSELGRVPALQRKVEELSRKLSEPRAPLKKEEPAATKTSVATGKFAEKLAQVKAVDPDLASLLEELREDIRTSTVEPLRQELTSEVTKTQQNLRDKENDQLFEREWNKLIAVVPQAEVVYKHPLYKQWKSEQSENVQALAGSIYADEALIGLELFAKYAAIHAPELVKQPDAPVEQPPVVKDPIADKVAADRARKLASGNPGPAANPPKQGTGLPDDPEALFNYLAEKIRKGESYKL